MVAWDMRNNTEMIYSLFILFTSYPAENNLGSVFRVTNTKWLDSAGSMQTADLFGLMRCSSAVCGRMDDALLIIKFTKAKSGHLPS